MKRSVYLGAVTLLWMVASGTAAAEDKFRVGIVDMRAVLVESQAGKHFKEEMAKVVKQKQDEIAKEEEKLKGMQAAYEKDQLILSDDQKKQKQKDFQDRVNALQKMSQEAQRELGQKDQEFTRKAVVEIRPIVEEVAKAEKVRIVYERGEQSVLYVEEAVDLTAKVLKAYDAKSAKK